MDSKVLQDCVTGRNNNFNLIRFLAACLVLVSHSFTLLGLPEPLGGKIGMTGGSIAVDIFFVTSGFLIAGSFFRCQSIIQFLWARFLRIYPALFVAVLFCTFIVGGYFTKLPLSHYLSHAAVSDYFIHNITLVFGVSYVLPEVFSSNTYPHSVNGSLWTLPYELRMYLYLAVIGTIISSFGSNKSIRRGFIVITGLALIACLMSHFSAVGPLVFLRFFAVFL